MSTFYPIGTAGQPWSTAEVAAWRARQRKQRSYAVDVLAPLEALASRFVVEAYGAITCNGETFPLQAVRNRGWREDLPTMLVTGGVHGYETSGVHGALQFLREHAEAYAGRANLLVVPCVSPWAYEHVQRWNFDALDPNRNFFPGTGVAESAALLSLLAPLQGHVLMHIDLHETTDTDESEFSPAKAARDGETFTAGVIPDGFYLVDDAARPEPEFQRVVLEAVAGVTHIALPDVDGRINGCPLQQPGVIAFPVIAEHLCAAITGARLATTTEVYPDSPRATFEQCNAAQVTAVLAAIDYALAA